MSKNLTNSLKKYNNYKVCNPNETIDKITKGFDKLNLKINFKEWFNNEVFVSTANLENDSLITAGKSHSSVLSKASAYGELAERFSSMLAGEFYTNLSKYFEEKHKNGALCSYTDLNKEKIGLDYFFYSFKENFKEDKKILDLVKNFPFLWEDAASLINNKTVKIPYFWHRTNQGSNGLASGNSIEEAIFHAIAEILERYCLSQTILNEYILPTIKPESATNNDLLKIIDFFNKENIEFTIKDCSLGMPLATIGVLFNDKNCSGNNDFVNTKNNNLVFGTDTDPQIAAMRCFTEYVQCYWKGYEKAEQFCEKWEKLGLKFEPNKNDIVSAQLVTVRLFDASFLKKASKTISFLDIPNNFNSDYLVEINNCLDAFKKLGYDVLFIDQTHPIINFPVAQIIIPELQIAHRGKNIINIFSKLAFDYKITYHSDKYFQIIENHLGYKPKPSLEDFILFEKWYDNEIGITKFINKIEKNVKAEPMEFNEILNVSVYAILAYLYISIGKLKKAYDYSKMIPAICISNPNNTKKFDMLFDYARIQKFLTEKGFKQNKDSIGLLKIMQSTGLSTDIDDKWKDLGKPHAKNPFKYCDFNCEKCNTADEYHCIWKNLSIKNFN